MVKGVSYVEGTLSQLSSGFAVYVVSRNFPTFSLFSAVFLCLSVLLSGNVVRGVPMSRSSGRWW